jgi:hypothetical protein
MDFADDCGALEGEGCVAADPAPAAYDADFHFLPLQPAVLRTAAKYFFYWAVAMI